MFKLLFKLLIITFIFGNAKAEENLSEFPSANKILNKLLNGKFYNCKHLDKFHSMGKRQGRTEFPKGIGKNYIDFCSAVEPSCISIDYEVDPHWIKEKLNGIPVQGGIDPKILLGDKEEIKKNTEKYLNIFKNYPYIFNLGHGVLPETKPETIQYIIQIIRNNK